MEVAGFAGAFEVEVAGGVAVGADADFGHVGVFVEEVGDGDPAFCGRSLCRSRRAGGGGRPGRRRR